MDDDGFERKLACPESGEREPGHGEKAARACGLRRNMYEHLNISVRTLDAIIAAVSLSIAALIIIGILRRP